AIPLACRRRMELSAEEREDLRPAPLRSGSCVAIALRKHVTVLGARMDLRFERDIRLAQRIDERCDVVRRDQRIFACKSEIDLTCESARKSVRRIGSVSAELAAVEGRDR